MIDAYDLYNTWFSYFFSVIATLFDIASSIFKLKNFNCSFVPVPFIKLGHLGHSLASHIEIMK